MPPRREQPPPLPSVRCMERDVDLGTGYAFKRLLLGRPLATSRLEHERLGRPTALAVFSYRQTIKAYPTAGGAYIVTKDNLGLLPAQLAGVALLVDYVLTVSVSTAAGVQAISSVHPLSVPVRIGLSLFFVWLIAYGNL